MSTLREVHTEGEIDALVDEIVSPNRREPIVALTSRKRSTTPALDPSEVRQELGEQPPIVLISDGRLTHRLAERLTPELAVYGGAARIWWPGATRDSDPQAHPLILERHAVYGSLALQRLAEAYHRGPSADSSQGSDAVSRAALELEERARKGAEAQLAELRSQVSSAREENERLRSQLRTARDQNTEMRAELRVIEKAARAHPAAPTHLPDRARFIRELIASMIEDVGGSTDRVDGFRFGREFVRSTLSVDVALERIAWVCAFVLARSADEMVGLELHPLRTGPGGDDPQRVRQQDGAKAWRVAVRRNTPGAPRLHFWRAPNGTVEFAAVGHHDQMQIV